MRFADVNYLAVLVVAVISFVLGGLWYSPPLFGKIWLAGIGKRADELGSPAFPLALNLVAAIITSTAFAAIILSLNLKTAAEGLTFGAVVGVGIIAASMASDFAFNRFASSLFLAEAGYRVILSLIMGLLLTIWK